MLSFPVHFQGSEKENETSPRDDYVHLGRVEIHINPTRGC